MKQGLLLLTLLLCSKLIYSQSLFKNLKTFEQDNSRVYNLLDISDKNSIIIQYSSNADSSIPSYTYYIVLTRNKLVAYTYITLEDHIRELEKGNLLESKNYTHKFTNRFIKRKINKLKRNLTHKKYLQNIKQEDLNIKPHEHDYLMYSHCGTAYIEFYQGNKSYKLEAECTKYHKGRNKESLALFNELYKLLNDTWNIQNGVQGRFIENNENN